MKATIKIVAEPQRQYAIELIRELPLDAVHSVTIAEYKKDLSADQRALYWLWLTVVGNYLGESKDQMHLIYKEKFLITIYERDDPEYAAMIHALRLVYKEGLEDTALLLRKHIVALTSITNASASQMAEYLTNIFHHAVGIGLVLQKPEDRKLLTWNKPI